MRKMSGSLMLATGTPSNDSNTLEELPELATALATGMRPVNSSVRAGKSPFVLLNRECTRLTVNIAMQKDRIMVKLRRSLYENE